MSEKPAKTGSTPRLRKKSAAERERRLVEIERNAILDNIPEIAWLKDSESRFLAVNAALARSLGREPAGLVGLTDLDLYPVELAQRYREDDAEVIRTGQPKRVVEPYQTAATGQRWIETVKSPIRDEDGLPIGTTGIARDVTERVQLEQELRRTTETLSAVIAASPIAIVGYDLEARITLWSAAAQALFGWREQEVLGQPSPILPPEDRGRVEKVRAATTQGQVTQYEAVRLHKDGRRLDVRATVGPIREADGSILGFVGLVQDITEERRAEKLLEQARKLESLGVLAGGVAHDFNNLLAAVIGHATLALGKLPADSPARSNLRMVIESSQRAADISQKMRALSGHGHFRRQAVELGRAVKDCLPMLQALCPPTIELCLAPGPDLPPAAFDPAQVPQLLRHLVANAVEAIGEGPGRIEIATRLRTVGADDWSLGHATGVALAAGDYVAIEVRDDGSGIEPANLTRVFEPFFSTRFTGRGLGLPVVLGIVRGHGGGVEIESAPGRGTCVRIVLPRHDPASEVG
jgi:PAS domain S-box-containing protein